MYETEANSAVEGIDQIPPEVVTQLRDFRAQVDSRTLLPWGEHCTECVWPTCYTSCDLYSPREDGRCRRFVEGMVRVDSPGTVTSYLLKIRFKRWGKLWAPGNLRMFSLSEADKREQRDQRIGAVLHQVLPLPRPVRNFATGKRYGWKKRATVNQPPSAEAPNLFVVECYNPGVDAIALSLTIRASAGEAAIPYQAMFQVPPGFHRESISVDEISARLSLRDPFSVDLIPNDISDGTTLYFGLIDFVTSNAPPPPKRRSGPSVKCIVWDLDNTLWDGTLVEDGSGGLVPKAGIIEIIREMDRRGVLHSIASKNNFDEAMAVLKAMGLEEYFLYPQISWNPKSEALKTIAAKLNIGIDTLLFIDDSDFELAEVRSACPAVQVLAADRYRELSQMDGCQGKVTEESANRRKMYRLEALRETSSQGFAGDYVTFLRDCRIELQIEPLSPANLDRVHELTQRTNQMNFSGNRYDRKLLEAIAGTPNTETYVLSCRDRFGSYGIVGFSVLDAREPRMTDLMFSCRIQAKRVEHAFLAYLLNKYARTDGLGFFADYRKTPRNAPSGRVFEDMGFEETGTTDGISRLVFRTGREIPDDGVIQVIEASVKAPDSHSLCGAF